MAIILCTLLALSYVVPDASLMAYATSECVYTPNFGTWRLPAQSCKQIKDMNAAASNGIYYILDTEGSVFPTYCDMITGGGGWTLIASIHENSMTGRCTPGDRWSSEQGNNPNHPHGDGNWANRAIFGSPQSATSDDYKSSAYYSMTAKDIMIWHVPNNTPLDLYEHNAFMKYHTFDGFLSTNGGNLQKLYSELYPLLDDEYEAFTDNGPAVEIMWARGNDDLMRNNTPTHVLSETEPGYIQFRVISQEGSVFAICPGIKMIDNGVNVEHVCVGGTSYHDGHERIEEYCGDFGAKDWDGYATGIGSSANQAMTESVVMIFYR